MKRLGLVVRGALLGVLFTLPVSADAPVDQYANFDSYSRFITDKHTKLVWERPAAPYPDAMKFLDAQAHCTALGAGYRLPTLKELLTIVDEEPHDEYENTANVARYIDRSAFPKTPAEQFWSSSMKDATKAWTVDFGSGDTVPAGTSSAVARVRCVLAQN